MHKTNNHEKQNNCLICYKSFDDEVSFHNLISIHKILCDKCQNSFQVLNAHMQILGVDTWILYKYDTFLKSLIYQYKGCYDIALKDVFLYKYKNIIKRRYKNYVIVFPPSSDIDDQNRGFKHIEQMVDCLSMKVIDIFKKNKEYKQSDQHFSKRNNIVNIIDFKCTNIDPSLNYLIVDDIYTSGSTLKCLIKLLSKAVKKEHIKALIVSKV